MYYNVLNLAKVSPLAFALSAEKYTTENIDAYFNIVMALLANGAAVLTCDDQGSSPFSICALQIKAYKEVTPNEKIAKVFEKVAESLTVKANQEILSGKK